MKFLRLVFRIPGFIIVTMFFALLGLLLKLLGFSHSVVFKVAFRPWQKVMVKLLNVKITVQGHIPAEPAIIMANHRSYVDVLMLLSPIPAVFVAKASVKKWPIVGLGGNALDTLWVNRESKDSRRETRDQLRDRLVQNKSVIIFPEGTTNRGPEVLDLKPGMFHTVADGGFKIIPLAIEYKNADIAWVDDQTFVPHFCEQFSKPKIEVLIKYGSTLEGKDGEELRTLTHKWLSEQTLLFRKAWDKTEKEA